LDGVRETGAVFVHSGMCYPHLIDIILTMSTVRVLREHRDCKYHSGGQQEAPNQLLKDGWRLMHGKSLKVENTAVFGWVMLKAGGYGVHCIALGVNESMCS